MRKMYFILSLMILSTSVFSQHKSFTSNDISVFLEEMKIYSNYSNNYVYTNKGVYFYTNKVECDDRGIYCSFYKQKCGEEIEIHKREDVNYKLYSRIPINLIPFDTTYTTVVGEKEFINSIYIPKEIYNEFKYGRTLMKAGGITIGVGTACCLGGAISYVVASKRKNIDALKSGNILMGIGGSLISVSIPLLSCGTFHKWHSKHDFNLHCL